MRPGQVLRIVCLLGQGQEFLRQPLRLLRIPACVMQPSQAQQHRKTLRGVADLLAQGERPGIGRFDFWGTMAPGEASGTPRARCRCSSCCRRSRSVRQGIEQR